MIRLASFSFLVCLAGLLWAAGEGGPAGGSGAPSPSLYRVNAEHISVHGKADVSKMLRARVTRVVDGDTVVVEPVGSWPGDFSRKEKIRLLGVDTPETVHPKKPVERFGKEASAYTKQHLLGREVLLAFDWELRDRYDRLLCYIYYPDGICFNASLISEGYGYAYLKYSFAFKKDFSALEKKARSDARGLWAGK